MNVLKLYSRILSKAKEEGASLVGIANVQDLKKAPSYTAAPVMPPYNGVGANKERIEGLKSGEVRWPQGAKSVIVIAYAHPKEKPELDFRYGSKGPSGNKKLIQIADNLIKWLQQEHLGVNAVNLPYHVERGGIYLKDAAVFAGLGCIGRNNLLVTPEYGPRIRLRGIAADINLPSTGPTFFDPCEYCDELCKEPCPQDSFKEQVYTSQQLGRKELPGRVGDYNRTICNIQMKIDEDKAKPQSVEGIERRVRVVKYCRVCEFSCPIGQS
ncbi:hypothetical protein MFMK1_000908 [Metallumcola ferriviriculae]|uniref:Epoxyqueuosine reductase n=1 Tax=Metallumcola ferriviriculae TaxID=3039180 RepID=A0AAU0UIH8_9FIRM|nr:hypothetical protein MFMK1_000908 [Desulfitibacteraceae bacterium MK1]